jgi:trypsin
MGNEVEKIGVTRVYTHPEYNAQTNNNDFALVFMDAPAVSNVNYVRVNDDAQVPSTTDTLTAIGWGDTSAGEGYDYSNTLMEVDVDYMENDECDASSDSKDSYNGMIYDAMLCASRPGKDGCQGDSGKFTISKRSVFMFRSLLTFIFLSPAGGPIIIKGSDASQDIQVGVASWGYGCASPDFPGV